jgi:integrase
MAIFRSAKRPSIVLPWPHDFRRTASTALHEAGFQSDWIEKCLAHEQRGVRAVYNKAEYADQRRHMMQAWANMVDNWTTTGG